MKALKRLSIFTLFVLILLLALTACKPKADAQVATDTNVVAEGQTTCAAAFEPGLPSTPLNDPTFSVVNRAEVVVYHIDCGVPYVTQRCVNLQDSYTVDGTTRFTSQFECITDEGGVWKGTCDATDGINIVCQANGEALYQGLALSTSADFETFTLNYKVTRLPSAEEPAEE